MANVWMHNGFLQVEGEKMSKSLGNFVTIRELLETKDFGGRQWNGSALRLAMLRTHYRQPIDWTIRALEEADAAIESWREAVRSVHPADPEQELPISEDILASLSDDLNLAPVIAELHRLAREARGGARLAAATLLGTAELLGFDLAFFSPEAEGKLFDFLAGPLAGQRLDDLIAARLEARRARNFAEADRIRNELDAMGIALKDAKDPATGEIVTTWEVKR